MRVRDFSHICACVCHCELEHVFRGGQVVCVSMGIYDVCVYMCMCVFVLWWKNFLLSLNCMVQTLTLWLS